MQWIFNELPNTQNQSIDSNNYGNTILFDG